MKPFNLAAFDRGQQAVTFDRRNVTLVHRMARGGHQYLMWEVVGDFETPPFTTDETGLCTMHVDNDALMREGLATLNVYLQPQERTGYINLYRSHDPARSLARPGRRVFSTAALASESVEASERRNCIGQIEIKWEDD